ncbi:TolC family protein, partial [Zoogloea oryzae]|uniref:TolC family protein n=1 Tax=Zoogloea oryzae TaxID=310767 RepID=UPI0024E0B72F
MLPLRRLTRHLLMAALLLPAISHAQTADTPPLSLQDAEKRLLDANPTILQARAAVAGARAGIDIAGARPNPIVTASVTSINPTRSGNGGYWDRPVDNVLRVDQMIERGDKRDLRLAAAERNLAATGLDLDNTIRLARIELASAWVDLRAAREVRRIADENAALARRAADAAEVRGKA